MGNELVAQLVQRSAAGDPAAMECLLLKYNAQLLRYVGRHLPRDMRRVLDAQDILQDIHFEVFRNQQDFRATSIRSALRWLWRIARNRLIDLVRMHRAAKRGLGRFRELDGEHPAGAMVPLLQELVVYERTPSRSAVAHELLVALQRSLDRLPQGYREAIRLRYMEGLSVTEAAARLSKTTGAIRMLCNRGLEALRLDLRAMSFCV